jgi:hypothetical protein
MSEMRPEASCRTDGGGALRDLMIVAGGSAMAPTIDASATATISWTCRWTWSNVTAPG